MALARLDAINVAGGLDLIRIDGGGGGFDGKDAPTLMRKIFGHDGMRKRRLGVGGGGMERCPLLILKTHRGVLKGQIHKCLLCPGVLDQDLLHGMREDMLGVILLPTKEGFIGGCGAGGLGEKSSMEDRILQIGLGDLLCLDGLGRYIQLGIHGKGGGGGVGGHDATAHLSRRLGGIMERIIDDPSAIHALCDLGDMERRGRSRHDISRLRRPGMVIAGEILVLEQDALIAEEIALPGGMQRIGDDGFPIDGLGVGVLLEENRGGRGPDPFIQKVFGGHLGCVGIAIGMLVILFGASGARDAKILVLIDKFIQIDAVHGRTSGLTALVGERVIETLIHLDLLGILGEEFVVVIGEMVIGRARRLGLGMEDGILDAAAVERGIFAATSAVLLRSGEGGMDGDGVAPVSHAPTVHAGKVLFGGFVMMGATGIGARADLSLVVEDAFFFRAGVSLLAQRRAKGLGLGCLCREDGHEIREIAPRRLADRGQVVPPGIALVRKGAGADQILLDAFLGLIA